METNQKTQVCVNWKTFIISFKKPLQHFTTSRAVYDYDLIFRKYMNILQKVSL